MTCFCDTGSHSRNCCDLQLSYTAWCETTEEQTFQVRLCRRSCSCCAIKSDSSSPSSWSCPSRCNKPCRRSMRHSSCKLCLQYDKPKDLCHQQAHMVTDHQTPDRRKVPSRHAGKVAEGSQEYAALYKQPLSLWHSEH